MDPERISETHRTRISTVPMQLSNILAELGLPRQADIVRVLRHGKAVWAKVP